MDKPIDAFWRIRLEELKEVLEANNFEVFIADTAQAAKQTVLDDILPAVQAESVSWGGSMTLVASGLYAALKDLDTLEAIDTFDMKISDAQKAERRRKALLADLFVTGTNAVTEEGQLVNLDMIGNRVGAITFGPRHVVLLVGRNKIVADLDAAWERIKDYVAPTNAMRLKMKTPCVKTGRCEECSGPYRICNSWAITEKSFPKKRIKVVLINEDLGL